MNLVNILLLFVCILFAITLHEVAHAYAGHLLGDDTAKRHGRLTLNPLAHIDPVMTLLLPMVLLLIGMPPFGAAKPVPYNPLRVRYGEIGAALVAMAGPGMNLLLAAIAGLMLQFFAFDINSVASLFLLSFLSVNVSFFLFNIIPFPPLDGSRVVYAFAPEILRRAFEWMESMGTLSILLFFLIFSTVLIGPFSHIYYWLVNLLIGG